MKSCCLAYVQIGTVCVCVVFCLNRSDWNCNYRCFLILKFELSFLKRFNLVSKIIICRLLSRSFSDYSHDLFEGY